MNGDADPAIRARGLTKRFGSVTAITDLDLSVTAGTVYGFLGANGAGKTTTIRILTGLLRPSNGTATVAGVDVSNRSALARRIGYVPNEPPLFEDLTGAEQLSYAAEINGVDPEERDERLESLLDAFDLTDDIDRPIREYSTGMRRKTSIIQAMLHDPDVVFLDEPTAGLDPNATSELKRHVRDVVAEGTTVFFSSHVIPVVDEIADTVGVLANGNLVEECSPEELKRLDGEGTSLEDAVVKLLN